MNEVEANNVLLWVVTTTKIGFMNGLMLSAKNIICNKKTVHVYRLVTKNTVEERILRRAR